MNSTAQPEPEGGGAGGGLNAVELTLIGIASALAVIAIIVFVYAIMSSPSRRRRRIEIGNAHDDAAQGNMYASPPPTRPSHSISSSRSKRRKNGSSLKFAEQTLTPMTSNPLAGDGAASNNCPELARERVFVGKILARGKFGRTREGRLETSSGQAVPIVLRVQADDLNMAETNAFLKELDVVRSIQADAHPNLCCPLGVATKRKPIWMILPYFSGGKLTHHLRVARRTAQAPQTVSSAEQLRFMLECTQAVSYLHSQGITHNRICGRSVLLTSGLQCKLSDYGRDPTLAANSDILRWLAPEAMSTAAFSPAADSWSLGVLFWEIISLGATPYINVPASKVVQHVQGGHYPDPLEPCPKELQQLMTNCWKRQPHKRTAVNDIQNELTRLVASNLLWESVRDPLPYLSMSSSGREARSISAAATKQKQKRATLSVLQKMEPVEYQPSFASQRSSSAVASSSTTLTQDAQQHQGRVGISAASARPAHSFSGTAGWDSTFYDIERQASNGVRGGQSHPLSGTIGWDSSMYDTEKHGSGGILAGSSPQNNLTTGESSL